MISLLLIGVLFGWYVLLFGSEISWPDLFGASMGLGLGVGMYVAGKRMTRGLGKEWQNGKRAPESAPATARQAHPVLRSTRHRLRRLGAAKHQATHLRGLRRRYPSRS
jgi:hypothetical protein